MFEQDYIMREIDIMIRMIMKLVFGKERKSDSALWQEVFGSLRDKNGEPDDLVRLLNEKRLKEAEGVLFERITNRRQDDLLTGLAFYDYLQSLSPEELEISKYTPEDAAAGMKHLLQTYGLGQMNGLFLT